MALIQLKCQIGNRRLKSRKTTKAYDIMAFLFYLKGYYRS